MDPITHTMAGAVMARAGLDRRGTLPLAGATLMLAANAPDIDIFVMFVGNYAGLAFRRGWTHGPLALLALPLALTGLMVAFDRLVRRRGARGASRAPVDARATLLIALVGTMSHPLLDWLNTYGIRLLMPFSGEWFYGDAVFIVDPWLWLMLAAALVPWRRTPGRVRLFGSVAVAYVLAMIVASRIAEPIAGLAADAAGIKDVEEVMYQPAPARPHRGSVIAATADAYHRGSFAWLPDDGERVSFDSAPIARGDWASPAVVQALSHDDVRDYLTWSRFPFVRTEEGPDGVVVRFGDVRFTDGPAGGGLQGVRVTVRSAGVDRTDPESRPD
jgi:inner membrane protein